MLLITVFFYKEPARQIEDVTLKQKWRDLVAALSDVRFSIFLVLLGVFFWLPFWAFFNLCAIYIDGNVDTAQLYRALRSVLGAAVAGFFSRVDEDGTRRVLGETIAHTGWIIMILQVFVSRVVEKWPAMASFLSGLFVSAVGFVILGLANVGPAAMVFPGIFFFAVGEMISSPRIQEYITWIAPKEKAGLYMGANFLAFAIGGFLSGVTYTNLSGIFIELGHAEYVWYVMAAHLILAIAVMMIFRKVAGEFQEQET
jgi:POT family proton-dependent oligopeptide transporter